MGQRDLTCPDCFLLPLCVFVRTGSLLTGSLYSSAVAAYQLLVELGQGCAPVSRRAGLCAG